MNVRESVDIALDALRVNKLRSFLTLPGVIFGVGSVIAVMSLVQGLDQYVGQQLTASGSNAFTIDKVGITFDRESGLPAFTPLWAVLVAFFFSVLVGIFFGLYPAIRASRLDPVEALRWE